MYEVCPCHMKLVFTARPKNVIARSKKLLSTSKNHSRAHLGRLDLEGADCSLMFGTLISVQSDCGN
jgi:hypothetical protein